MSKAEIFFCVCMVIGTIVNLGSIYYGEATRRLEVALGKLREESRDLAVANAYRAGRTRAMAEVLANAVVSEGQKATSDTAAKEGEAVN